MPTLTVKNIPTELYERLKRSAEEHRRSINSEILVCLERALSSERMDPEALVAQADVLRARARLSPVTDALLAEARANMVRGATEVAGEAGRPSGPDAPAAGEPGA